MNKINVQSASLEERFMFGSPPLLNGFNTCRMEEGLSSRYNSECCTDQLINHSHVNGYSTGNSLNLLDSLNQMSLYSSVLEHVNNKRQTMTFKKRKDLRTLQNALSKERYREVLMKFGDGGEDCGILASVHETVKQSNVNTLKCLFCPSQTQVFENFPVVDGTLFLTPVRLSSACINYVEKPPSQHKRYMCYICVKCLEGTSKHLRCKSCKTQWNGSFFQIGTLYTYNILSAMPCCQRQFSCNQCMMEILNMSNGEVSSLFFSHFSKKTECPHCGVEDFHFIKPLSMLETL